LEIHLRKRGYDIADFSKKDYAKFVGASKAYVGAEIETSLKDALINAFDADEELEMHHIIASLKEMTPLSKAYGYQIQMMTLWARENARPASKVYDDDFQEDTVEPKKGARVRVHHRRGSSDEQVH
jgi:SpoVK/Ycf46/Vps4 family AAA+-type ATPase